ncbi:MAG: DUF1127 domain-containing protein [Pseudomonadota bacterium]
MAYTTADQTTEMKTGLGRLADRLGAFLVRMGEMSEGARAAQRAGELAQLSDQQLAAIGLKRGDIVSHVFAKLHRG